MKLYWIRKNTGYVFRFLTQQFFIQRTVCYTATSERPFSSHFTPLPMYSLDMNTQGQFVTLMGFPAALYFMTFANIPMGRHRTSVS